MATRALASRGRGDEGISRSSADPVDSSKQLLDSPSTALSTASEQRPVIAQDHPRGVVAGSAGDAAAGVGAGAAVIKAPERPAVIGVAEHRACRKQLVQRERSMEDVAAQETELALQVQRRQDLPANHALRKAGRV